MFKKITSVARMRKKIVEKKENEEVTKSDNNAEVKIETEVGVAIDTAIGNTNDTGSNSNDADSNNHDTDSNSNDDNVTKKQLRPSRAVPALPPSDDEDSNSEGEKADKYKNDDDNHDTVGNNSDSFAETKLGRLNHEDLSTSMSSNHYQEHQHHSNSNVALDEKVAVLQRQNRTLLKQIVSMKQIATYSSNSSRSNNMMSTALVVSSPTFDNSSGGIKYDDEGGEMMNPLKRMKNQLALCELKLRRAHKNFHDLSKRTRELETENARAERNLLDLSHQLTVAQGNLEEKEKLYQNLQTKYS